MALFPESMMTRPAFQPFRFAVVGCGAKKADKLSVASELYLGDLFQKSYAHARREHGEHVLILSAHYGLLNPHTVVHPYDLQLGDLDGEARAKLGELVSRQLANQLRRWRAPMDSVVANVYAGAVYREFLIQHVKVPGSVMVLNNVFGRKQIGERLQWLKHELAVPVPTVAAPASVQ